MTNQEQTTKNLQTNDASEFTWAPLIPLIGGFPLGAEKAFGKPPEAIYSYDGFWGNDSQYVNYQQNTLGRDVEYITIDETDMNFERKINVIVGTPVCSGLSSLNTSKNPDKQGPGCKQNEQMYNVVRQGAKRFDADVIMLENAPGLATKKGIEVADNLAELGKTLGYVTAIYKTSTHFHGIPQRRDRTFAVFFKADKLPQIEWQKLESLPLKNFLSTMSSNVVDETTIINEKILDDVYYNFLKEKTGDVRETLISAGQVTCLNYVKKHHLADITEWVERQDNEKWKRKVRHLNAKLSKGLGVWDDSVHIFKDRINAVIGRNMNDSIHPTEDRSLTIAEALYLMGFPENFELVGGLKNSNMIAQNVPVCTAKFISEQAIKFLRGELEETDLEYAKFDNWNEKIENRG